MKKFLRINIEYESTLLKRVLLKHGRFSSEYQHRFKQLKALKEVANKKNYVWH